MKEKVSSIGGPLTMYLVMRDILQASCVKNNPQALSSVIYFTKLILNIW